MRFEGRAQVLLFACSIAICVGKPRLTIQQGALVGREYMSRDGATYFGFLGIPFAKPPVGELRFEPPQEPAPWNGTLDATRFVRECAQMKFFFLLNKDVYGQEDCLYLNVFTPDVNENSNLPVMVYIHGGAFTAGASSGTLPDYFMDKPIVLVTITYRVGVIGFLSAADEDLPGNMALKDQSMALKWVQRNIKSFGGNPNKVTIFGESAGAASVSAHLYSPLSKGLFHAAISESGSVFATWALVSKKIARQRFDAFAILLGCPITNTKVALRCLKQLTVEELLNAHYKFFIWRVDPDIPFTLVIEDEGDTAFLTKSPWEQDAINNVPFMAGINSAEGLLKVSGYLMDDEKLLHVLAENYVRLLLVTLQFNHLVEGGSETATNIVEEIKKFYIGDEKISTDNVQQLVHMYTDAYFGHCTIKAAMQHSSSNKVYFYYYDHKNEISFSKMLNEEKYKLGAAHADDLISLFYVPQLNPEELQGNDLEVSKRMISYWINFANYSNPNGNDDEVWRPMKSTLEYLHIQTDNDVMASHDSLKKRYHFWDSLPFIAAQRRLNIVRDEL